MNYSQKGFKILNEFGFNDPLTKSEDKRKNKMTYEDKEKSSKPDFNVCSPIKNNDKTFWQNIGAAWKGEKGISIKLNALPLGSEIMLFPYTEKKKD